MPPQHVLVAFPPVFKAVDLLSDHSEGKQAHRYSQIHPTLTKAWREIFFFTSHFLHSSISSYILKTTWGFSGRYSKVNEPCKSNRLQDLLQKNGYLSKTTTLNCHVYLVYCLAVGKKWYKSCFIQLCNFYSTHHLSLALKNTSNCNTQHPLLSPYGIIIGCKDLKASQHQQAQVGLRNTS